jgi:hypothetical protein
MTKHTEPLEPANVQRAQWAKNALAVFTDETYGGDRPEDMEPGDLESAIADLICDLLHFAHFHPRMNAVKIHEHARDLFETERADDRDRTSAETSPAWRDALLNIKRLAEKSGDDDADPFALLDLIAAEARTVLLKSTHK